MQYESLFTGKIDRATQHDDDGEHRPGHGKLRGVDGRKHIQIA